MASQAVWQILGALLLERGWLSPQALERAREEQHRTGELLGGALTRLGLISREQLMAALAQQAGVPSVRMVEIPIAPEALAKVPPTFASRYGLIPISLEEGTLTVATADPFDVQALDELRVLLGCDLRPVLASELDIRQAIERHYGVGASAVERLLDAEPPTAAHVPAAEDLTDKTEEASVIAFVNQLIRSAVRDRATDVHLEPFDRVVRVRQRIDGILYDVPVPPDLVKLHPAIVSRIKVMAKLNIAERRLPQDGRITVRLDDQGLDLRVSVLPTNFGETVTLRLLSARMLYSLEQLGLAGGQLTLLHGLIQRPHGIVFVTGPTGSGKTTTLYACLSRLNQPDRKLLTIEDPIEYQLHGITQLQVHPKIGMTFAQGLRSMLRHDPDVMMVGEVRDSETAEITIRSALTGHLVFSTLHTNDAAGGVTRLLDMGIESYLIASSILCFVAQRLVRVVCASCGEEEAVEARRLAEFGVNGTLPERLRRGRGCADCKGTGFRGRTAIYEFLLVNDAIRRLILRRAPSNEIAHTAQHSGSMRTLRQDGFQKVLRGVTTPEEVLRVT